MKKNKPFSKSQVASPNAYQSPEDEARELEAFEIELKKITADIKIIKSEVARRLVDVLSLELQKEVIESELESRKRWEKK